MTTCSYVKSMKIIHLDEPGISVNVRIAKAKLSSLINLAVQGQRVTINNDGEPMVQLVPVKRERKKFKVNWSLHKGPKFKGDSTDLIREDRDSRP